MEVRLGFICGEAANGGSVSQGAILPRYLGLYITCNASLLVTFLTKALYGVIIRKEMKVFHIAQICPRKSKVRSTDVSGT